MEGETDMNSSSFPTRRLKQFIARSIIGTIVLGYVVFLGGSHYVTYAQSTPPYPASSVIQDITWDFANLIRQAQGSDLWPNTWASDNNVYAGWGDGGGFG